MKKYDYVLVGAGLYSGVIAYLAGQAGKNCLVLERRDHTGGNIYCEEIEGIHVHKYGAHIFHTSNKEVWQFVNSLAEFNRYTNSPIANYKGEIYNMPFNMNTFSKMWGIRTPEEAKTIIEEQRKAVPGEPKNLEEQAIKLVGKDIYEKLVKGYTEKQWGRDCSELPSFIIKRLPVRFTYDNNYFNDIKEVDWAKDAIETLYERKIISGRGNSIFDPNGFVSREEFIKMVVVAAGITPGGNNNGGFSDVSVDSWYYPYICAAFQNGITKGIGENQFGIGKNIIRQDVFVMCDYLLNNTKTPDKEGIEKFVDSELVSDYAKDTIDKFTKLGIISGNDRGELNPKSDMTRAEAAKILYNILVLTNKI